MTVGDRVQHYETGSVGTVIDSTYEVGTPFQQMCVQWEDDLAAEKDTWERTDDLSLLSPPPYNYSFPE